jgi:8-hydroxy-5-deazaflavin:NADPH oxidoreductase
MTTLGIIGAGKLGTVIGRLAVAAGYKTCIAGSGDPRHIELLVDVLCPGAIPATASDVANKGDIIILAVPLSKVTALPAEQLATKVVVDATNYWPPTDGRLEEFETRASSPYVAASLPGTRVVKTLSHLGYHELDTDARPAGAPDRHAIAVAGDDSTAVAAAAEVVDRLGFDPVVVPGGLAAGSAFGPGTAPFGVSTDRGTLLKLLQPAVRH